MAMILFQEKKLFDATIDIGSRFIPRVVGKMLSHVTNKTMLDAEAMTYFICVRPCIRKIASRH